MELFEVAQLLPGVQSVIGDDFDVELGGLVRGGRLFLEDSQPSLDGFDAGFECHVTRSCADGVWRRFWLPADHYR